MSRPTVVLIHGLFGFRKLLWLEYFNGVRELYERMGMRVIVPHLPWGNGIERRSRALAEQLADEPGPLHLVAHSMGGVDARAYISKLGGDAKVASLTTLATPHRGSAAADRICEILAPLVIFPGIRALTMKKMQPFNETTPDMPGVVYRSFGTARPLAEQPWITRRYGRVIDRTEGDNDSQVSVTSATWGEYLGTLPADHFEIIGRHFWFNPFRKRERFDHIPVYRAIGEWILQQSEKTETQSR